MYAVAPSLRVQPHAIPHGPRDRIVDKAKIELNIKRISHYGKKMDAFVQMTALAVALHSHKHGEVSLVNKLVLAMADWKGARHKAMHSWVAAYCPVVLNADEAAAKTQPYCVDTSRLADEAGRNEIAIANGQEKNHWYNHKADPVMPEFIDVNAMLQAVMKKVTKLQKDGVPVKDDAMLAKLTAMMATASE